MPLVRATVGGKTTAAITNGIIDFVELPFDHIEYTATSASVASGTTSSVGTLVRDAAKSNVASIGTLSANTITLTTAGTYAIDLVGSIPVSPTGNYFARVFDGTNFFIANGSTVSGSIGGALASNYYAATAGVVLTFTFFHTSAANRVFTSRIAITQIGLG